MMAPLPTTAHVHMTAKKTLYLANPYGFSAQQRDGPLQELVEVLESLGADVWEPFARNNQIDRASAGWAYRIGQADLRDAFRPQQWHAQGRASRGHFHEPVRAGSPRPCGDQRDRRGASSPPPRRRSTQNGSRASLRGRTAGWRPLSGARRSHPRSSWSGQGRRGRHRWRRPTASVPGDRRRNPGPRGGSWQPGADASADPWPARRRRRAPDRSPRARSVVWRRDQAARPRRARWRSLVFPPVQGSGPSRSRESQTRQCQACR